MIPGTVGARHPRPKPNEKICCTFGRGLEHTILVNFYFLKWAMTYGRSLIIGDFYVFLIDFGRGWRAPTAFGLFIKSLLY